MSAETSQGALRAAAAYTESESPEPPEWALRQTWRLSARAGLGAEVGPSSDSASLFRYATVQVQVVVPGQAQALPGMGYFDGTGSEASFDVWEDFGYRGKLPARPLFACQTVSPTSHVLSDEPVRSVSRTRLSGAEDSGQPMVELLQAFDPDVMGLEVLAPQGPSAVYIRHRRLGVVPVYTMGDGLRRVLTMALALYRARGGVLLVDELETAIHASALPKLYCWLVAQCRAHGVQLFATTHSLEAVDTLLDAVRQQPETEMAAFRLSQRDGQTEALRLGVDQLARLRFDLGQEVR
jgi:hypothetical protein